jgi:pyruvate/2-oxoglutarate dehydrogenase complex dihydrolipoamide dehydrogenase (E3) component
MADTLLKPDLCIIGAGSAGLSLAAMAAALNVPVVLVERDKMGGDCLNFGCVPSKALLAAGKAAHAMQNSTLFGLECGDVTIHFDQVQSHVQDIIRTIEPTDSIARYEAMGVKVVTAEGRFTDDRTLQAGDYTIRARRFVIATGSRPFIPPLPGLNEVRYLTNETVFQLTTCPDHLLIIGGGPIGLEMAQAHHRLGAKVSLIEKGEILAREDREAAAIIRQQLQSKGIAFYENADIHAVSTEESGSVRVDFKQGQEDHALEGSHLLIATGRAPHFERLGLERAFVKVRNNRIKLSSSLRTTNRRIYAMGDVSSPYQFTHMASYEASLLARKLFFRLPIRVQKHLVPRTLYTEPEYASIGLSEAEALQCHRKARILRWSYHDNDRAIAERQTNGFIKVMTDRRGTILGCVIVGARAGELIHFWGLAMSQKLKVKDIAATVPAYPTYSEISKRASVEFYKSTFSSPAVKRLVRWLRWLG